VFVKTHAPGGPISIFDSAGAPLGSFSVPGFPTGLAFDSSANLYVATFDTGNIDKYAPGSNTNPTVFAGGLPPLEGIGFSRSGELFVTGFNPLQGTVYRVTPNCMTLSCHTLWASGIAGGPVGVTVDPISGDLFVTETGAGTILRFSTTSPGVASTFATGLASPYALAFDPGGNLYVDNFGDGTIWKFARASLLSPRVSAVTPTAGPFSGGTQLTITGSNFSSGDSVCFSGGGTANVPESFCTSTVTVNNSNTITAVTPPTLGGLYHAGAYDVSVVASSCPLCSPLPHTGVQFTYYVPEIGVLLAHDPKDNKDYACTASIVDSSNHSVVLTAAHCIYVPGQPGYFRTNIVYAPGYYGSLSCPTVTTTVSRFACGHAPLGVWSPFATDVPGDWACCTNHQLDFAYLDVRPQNGVTIGAQVGGGLVITFNPSRGDFWTLFGQPGQSLLECFAQAFDDHVAKSGPDALIVNDPACENMSEGASGGPWINSSNGQTYGIGAVNDTSNCPGGPGSPGCGPGVIGTYMGDEARAIFLRMEHIPSSP
jgi:hypothetical protein